MYFSPFPLYLVPLRPKYSPQYGFHGIRFSEWEVVGTGSGPSSMAGFGIKVVPSGSGTEIVVC
jgi:hypothetical protein